MIQPLQIKPTHASLAVLLDAQAGRLSFSGRSVSEHSVEFFAPIIDWLEKYAAAPAERTECVFKFEYFNSAARKSLIEIFKVIQSMHRKGKTLSIEWYYDEGDESMKELGEEYANLFNLKFQFIQD